MATFRSSRSGPTRREALVAGLVGLGATLVPGSARAAYQVRPWAADKPVPELDLSVLDGKRWSLASARGQVVVMNFWATWCEPCREEMPSLELLAERLKHDDVIIVAINYQDPLPAIRRFLDAQPVTLPILLDRNGAAASAWTPRVFPSTVLIDRSGKPREIVVGEVDWTGAAARELIAPLLTRAKTA